MLLVSGLDQLQPATAALEGGCAGFLPKTAGVERLLTAVERVAAGEAVFPAAAIKRLTRPTQAADPSLTERETAVLRLLADAASSAAISAALHISLHTVRNHIRSIMTKLGAKIRLEAVVIAAWAGLVDLSANTS